jgi:hypothetical protein
MPGIQWLGDVDTTTAAEKTKRENQSLIAQALKSGIGTYLKEKEKGEERALEGRKIEVAESEATTKQKQAEYDYSKLDYDKKKDAYDTMIKLLPSVPPEKQAELTSSPEWIALEKSLGMPSLSGSTISPEAPKPSWGQEQETASIKADLTRGQGSISTLMGEPLPVDIKTKEDALNYISKKGRDPAEFAVELTRFDTEASTIPGKGKGQRSPYKEYPDAYLEGGVWKVKRGGKVYKIEE